MKINSQKSKLFIDFGNLFGKTSKHLKSSENNKLIFPCTGTGNQFWKRYGFKER